MTQEKGYIYCQIWGKEFQVLSASGEVDWLGTGQESLHHSRLILRKDISLSLIKPSF